MQQFLTLDKAYSFAQEIPLNEIEIFYADYINKQIFNNPEYDGKGNRKPSIYPFLKKTEETET